MPAQWNTSTDIWIDYIKGIYLITYVCDFAIFPHFHVRHAEPWRGCVDKIHMEYRPTCRDLQVLTYQTCIYLHLITDRVAPSNVKMPLYVKR